MRKCWTSPESSVGASWGDDLEQARNLLASALVDMAEVNLEQGEPLPRSDPSATDPESDLEVPIFLLLEATSRITLVAHNTPS